MTPSNLKTVPLCPIPIPLKMKAALNQAARQAELQRLSKISKKILENPSDSVSAAWDKQDNAGKEVKGNKGPAPLFPKIILTPKQLTVIAALIRSREPIKSAVSCVLVKGETISEAMKHMQAKGHALTLQSIANAVKRFKAAHLAICEGYSPRN